MSMENKLKKVLLVDDSQSTNFFNKMIIERTNVSENVGIAKNGSEALEYLQSGAVPEVIFLDINMPVMNGWEFIAEYQKLEEEYKGAIIILMIGAELNHEERKLAESIPEIRGFREKMLTKEVVFDIVDKYFSYSVPELYAKKAI